MNYNWSTANSKLKKTGTKLKKKIVSFNLPAFKAADGTTVCIGAKDCQEFCYAKQGFYVMKTVQEPRESNYQRLRGRGVFQMFETLDADVKLIKADIIRIHDSGDFFSRDYVEAWRKVAIANPTKIFYAYTKSIPLFRNVKLPDNLRITFSMGSRWDEEIQDQPHSRVFSSHDEMLLAGYTDATESDYPAIMNEKKVGLVYHGTKKLTEELENLLR